MGLQSEKGDLYDGSKPGIKKRIEKSAHIYDCTRRGYWYWAFLGSSYTIHEAGPGGGDCSVSCRWICYVFNDALSWRVSGCDA